jgi:hypothetical protein
MVRKTLQSTCLTGGPNYWLYKRGSAPTNPCRRPLVQHLADNDIAGSNTPSLSSTHQGIFGGALHACPGNSSVFAAVGARTCDVAEGHVGVTFCWKLRDVQCDLIDALIKMRRKTKKKVAQQKKSRKGRAKSKGYS